MKRYTGIGMLFMALLWSTLGNGEETPPNFILILGEGHGWCSMSVQMDDSIPESKSSFVQTPNFEKLAREGMRLANFYAASPRCTPSRAAIFTGKSPAQLKMTFVGEDRRDDSANANRRLIPPPSTTELPLNEITIAELLKTAGYATAHFGKWHVGHAHPKQHGFDESDGPTSNGGPENVSNPHPEQLYGMTERGIDFMNRNVNEGIPFYLQLSHYASRKVADARETTIALVKDWDLDLNEQQLGEAASSLDLDLAFGQILDSLDKLGIADNSYVIYTTDHGTPGKNPPLSAGKGTVYEGGLRVPFIIRGPGIASGSCSHVRAFHTDLLPTLTAMAKVSESLPVGIEGGNLNPVLFNGGTGSVLRSNKEYVVYFPHYDKDPAGPAATILLEDYKLIHTYETERNRLFNISGDMGERNDLSIKNPERTSDLERQLNLYLEDVGQELPKQNLLYDPSKQTEGSDRKRGKGGRGGRE